MLQVEIIMWMNDPRLQQSECQCGRECPCVCVTEREKKNCYREEEYTGEK